MRSLLFVYFNICSHFSYNFSIREGRSPWNYENFIDELRRRDAITHRGSIPKTPDTSAVDLLTSSSGLTSGPVATSTPAQPGTSSAASMAASVVPSTEPISPAVSSSVPSAEDNNYKGTGYPQHVVDLYVQDQRYRLVVDPAELTSMINLPTEQFCCVSLKTEVSPEEIAAFKTAHPEYKSRGTFSIKGAVRRKRLHDESLADLLTNEEQKRMPEFRNTILRELQEGFAQGKRVELKWRSEPPGIIIPPAPMDLAPAAPPPAKRPKVPLF